MHETILCLVENVYPQFLCMCIAEVSNFIMASIFKKLEIFTLYLDLTNTTHTYFLYAYYHNLNYYILI